MNKGTEFTLILNSSPLGGVGVFAAHDIPSGMQVFFNKFQPRRMKISAIPEEFKKYIIYINDEECFCPEAFNRMEIGWYLNHSSQPNIVKNADGFIYAVHDIKKGEEILIDYNHLNEPAHLKEEYYK